MNEFIIENAACVPFRDMSEEDRIAILKAKLEEPKSVEMFSGNYWGMAGGSSLLFDYIYRVRAIDTSLVIPWEIISPKWDWAAMDKNKHVYFFTCEPKAAKLEWICNIGGDYTRVLSLNIDTTGIDWRRSKTRRPA